MDGLGGTQPKGQPITGDARLDSTPRMEQQPVRDRPAGLLETPGTMDQPFRPPPRSSSSVSGTHRRPRHHSFATGCAGFTTGSSVRTHCVPTPGNSRPSSDAARWCSTLAQKHGAALPPNSRTSCLPRSTRTSTYCAPSSHRFSPPIPPTAALQRVHECNLNRRRSPTTRPLR